MAVQSWGNYPHTTQQEYAMRWRNDPLPKGPSLLPHGQGRSYGDVALNDGGTAITTRFLNHFISFDETAGLLRCEAGVTVAEILEVILPRGWFLFVTPGTKFVSLGGAIANDVHGKNHYVAGSFGAYVTQFELLRSDGRFVCSPTQNPELFQATIGGLGLTGLITWAEIRLRPLQSLLLDSVSVKTTNLTNTLETINSLARNYEYVIASIDSAASQRTLGRALVAAGDHKEQHDPTNALETRYICQPLFTVPAPLPISPLVPFTITLFSRAFYHRQFQTENRKTVHYEPFFYPQDAIGYWNRLYGSKGFLQYQCHIPHEGSQQVLHTLLRTVKKSGLASPITTLKLLGKKNTPARLSFPRPGFTLALDFPNSGQRLLDLFAELDTIVMKSGGSLYPAKDAHMSPTMFKHFYPEAEQLKQYIDPAFSSSFWRRVTKNI